MARRDGSLWVVTDEQTGTVFALETAWTISRGRDTYGYNVCTLYVDGEKVARCNGGGYDMTGTVVGDWLQNTFQARLLTLQPAYTWRKEPYRAMERTDHHRDTYGLTHQLDANDRPIRAEMDGGCGIESMISLAGQIGVRFAKKR